MNTIQLGDYIIEPKITHKALKYLIEVYQIDLLSLFANLAAGKGLSPVEIERIVFVSLMHDPRITTEFVEDNMNIDDYPEYIQKIIEAFRSSCPKLFPSKKK